MEIDLQKILKELYEISGFRISVYDLNLHEIASYPAKLSPFCSCLQQNKKAKQNCIEQDQNAFAKVRQEGKPYIYRCRFGLYEAVAPLYYFDVLSGFLIMGQALDSCQAEKKQVLALAQPFVSNKEQLLQAIDSLPVCSRQKLSSYLSIMSVCAEYITLSNRFGPRSASLPQQIKQYLKQHYTEKILLDQLCTQFYCSKATLTQSFRQEYGETIHEYLLHLRIKQAKTLLLADGKISEIAVKCGFSEQNYFCKVFLRETGMTPTEYRRSVQMSKNSSF